MVLVQNGRLIRRLRPEEEEEEIDVMPMDEEKKGADNQSLRSDENEE
jgi:hypothetical protein